MATESSRSSADSYIGSLISLTSKSEIRYEGILYNINTEESSIGLRNVRSFGTEGRKKDGPQLMPSDKVYEYILFRGSDIKDLQVKSSQPVQPTQPIINNDPAIIQSHYPRPPPLSSAPTNTLPDLSIQNPPTLQSGPPLYPPGPNLGSWAPMPPPPTNTTGLPMPMYWPGFYTPPNGVPQLHQQSLIPPPPPPHMQYPSYNGSLPGGALNMSVGPTAPMESLPTPSLVTPGQLLQSGVTTAVVSLSSQVTQTVHKDVEEVVQVAPTSSSELELELESSIPIPVPVPAQPPILALPPQARITPKVNGGSYQNRQSYNYRGRERGRGYGGSRSVVKFTEEFDFNAMNEKFNKDEIWGTLGKTNDGNVSAHDDDDDDEYEDENENGADVHVSKVEAKNGVYSKDDFFDTLSCNSLDNQSNNGRTRFSEQMKLDTETFGEFSRYRGGGRGGRGGYRGGGYSRGGGGYGRGGGGGYYGYGRRGGGGYNSYGGRSQNQSRDY